LLSRFGVIAIERDGKAKPFTWPPSLTELKVRSYGAGSIHYGVQTERDA
jgi:16S rRNA (guanine966-N2)-methyltransferase